MLPADDIGAALSSSDGHGGQAAALLQERLLTRMGGPADLTMGTMSWCVPLCPKANRGTPVLPRPHSPLPINRPPPRQLESFVCSVPWARPEIVGEALALCGHDADEATKLLEYELLQASRADPRRLDALMPSPKLERWIEDLTSGPDSPAVSGIARSDTIGYGGGAESSPPRTSGSPLRHSDLAAAGHHAHTTSPSADLSFIDADTHRPHGRLVPKRSPSASAASPSQPSPRAAVQPPPAHERRSARASECVVGGSFLHRPVVGVPVTIEVFARREAHEPVVPIDLAELRVVVMADRNEYVLEPSTFVSSAQAGGWSARWTPALPGFTPVLVSIGKELVPSSPFTVYVLPTLPSPKASGSAHAPAHPDKRREAALPPPAVLHRMIHEGVNATGPGLRGEVPPHAS